MQNTIHAYSLLDINMIQLYDNIAFVAHIQRIIQKFLQVITNTSGKCEEFIHLKEIKYDVKR